MATTAEQQLALELINQARLDPDGEYDRLVTNASPAVQSALTQFGVDLTLLASQFDELEAVAALAWSDTLAVSATNQNDLMNEFDQQGHFLGDQLDEFGNPLPFNLRFEDAGYTGWQALGENIFAFTSDPDFAHAGFFIDWGNTPTGIQDPAGHRDSIMSGAFTEVGVGWTAADPTNTNVGPFLTTQHFGTTFAYDAQLLGVVIDDLDNDDFYDIGEGMGGVSISAVGTSGEGTFVTTSWASGGYQMVLPEGVFNVTFSGGGLVGPYTVTVVMGDENVKLDVEADDVDGPQVLVGDGSDDVLTGGAFNDTISGNDGRDTLSGEGGLDEISGGRGKDLIFGGAGDDTLSGEQKGDRLEGGDGNDELSGNAGRDRLFGQDGDDTLEGGGGLDVLRGGAGNDILDGGRDDDELVGNSGDDVFINSDGSDTNEGGSGADTFVFDDQSLMDGTGDLDVILDFESGTDLIDVSGMLGGQSFAVAGAAGFNNQAGEIAITTSGGDTFVHFDFDGDGASDSTVELSGFSAALTASDFIL